MCGNLISVLANSFSRLAFWWRNPLPSTLRRPRKPWYQYSRAIWSIWEVLNAIYILYFCASIIEKIWSHWGELYDTCALSWHSPFNEKAERAKEGALTCPYPSWRQSSSAISSPSLFLRTKFFAFVLIVHEYSFNHLACEQAHFCKFGENFGCRRGKVTKKESRIDPKLLQSFANNQV